MTDQVETLSEQVPDGTLFFWIDIPFGKDLEPEKVGKPEGTLFVVPVLLGPYTPSWQRDWQDGRDNRPPAIRRPASTS